MTEFEVYELMTPSPEEKEIVSRIENDPILGTFMQLAVHLGHFKYAMGQLKSTMISDKRYAFGFYSESILRRIGDWFAEPKNMPDSLIDQALKKVRLDDDVIRPLDQLLDSPIGQTTWRRFIKDYRNAASAHGIFDGDTQSKVCQKYGVSQESLSNESKRSPLS